MAGATLPIDKTYTSLDDVIASLTEVERIFRARRDRRAVFATTYLAMSMEMRLSLIHI